MPVQCRSLSKPDDSGAAVQGAVFMQLCNGLFNGLLRDIRNAGQVPIRRPGSSDHAFIPLFVISGNKSITVYVDEPAVLLKDAAAPLLGTRGKLTVLDESPLKEPHFLPCREDYDIQVIDGVHKLPAVYQFTDIHTCCVILAVFPLKYQLNFPFGTSRAVLVQHDQFGCFGDSSCNHGFALRNRFSAFVQLFGFANHFVFFKYDIFWHKHSSFLFLRQFIVCKLLISYFAKHITDYCLPPNGRPHWMEPGYSGPAGPPWPHGF